MAPIGPADLVERAFAATKAQVDMVEPARLTLPTPCAAWDVRTLLNHIIGGAHWYADTMSDGVSPPLEGDDDDYAAADFRAAYADGIGRAERAFTAPGALDASVEFVGRSTPGSTVARLCALDTFVHGWDLARALGRSTDLDPELADDLASHAAPRLPAVYRGTTDDALYRPPCDAPADSTSADRLAAFLGRTLAPGR